MSKQAFSIEGDFQMGRVRQHFVLQFPAESEEEAKDHVYADLGSRHGVKRRDITIESVKVAETADAITQKRIERA